MQPSLPRMLLAIIMIICLSEFAFANIDPELTAKPEDIRSLSQVRERLRHMDRQERHDFFNKTKQKYKRFSPEEKAAFRKEIKTQLAQKSRNESE